tara:strand:+ start:692 stop:1216 length:525 start_codon:yes stop_codon:yes gene_type:complete
MRKLSLILLGTIILTLIPNLSISAKNIIQGRALVLDGDTIRIGNKKIRFSGIDSPESFYRGKKQYCYLNKKKISCGDLAKRKLKEKIKNNQISCNIENNKDFFKRLLGECFLNNISLSKFMVRNGYAFDYKKYSKSKYAKDEKYAKDNKLGLWLMKFEYPWVWRDKIRSNIIKE